MSPRHEICKVGISTSRVAATFAVIVAIRSWFIVTNAWKGDRLSPDARACSLFAGFGIWRFCLWKKSYFTDRTACHTRLCRRCNKVSSGLSDAKQVRRGQRLYLSHTTDRFFSGFTLAAATSIILQRNPDIVAYSYLSSLYAILPSTPFYALLFVLVSLGRSYGLTMLAYAPLLILQPLAHLVFFFFAVTLGVAANGVTASLAFTIATTLVCLGALPWLRYSIPQSVLAARCMWVHRDWLEFSLPTAISLAASSFMIRFPTLVLGFFSPNAEVGRFVVLLALAQVLAIARDAIAGALAPEIMRRLSEKDATGLRDVLRRGFLFSFGITFCGALGLWVLGDFVLAALGPSFVSSQSLLAIMIVDQLIQASSLLLSTFLSVAERPRVNVFILSASTLVCIILSTSFAAYLGAEGAALGAIGGSLTLLLATLFVCWKKSKSVYV